MFARRVEARAPIGKVGSSTISIVAALLVLAALVLPAVANAVFSTPFNLSAVGFDAKGSGPEVALDPSGNAVFVWQGAPSGSAQIQTRARSAGGTLSAVQVVATSTASDPSTPTDPDVAVDSNGNAVIVWVRPAGTAFIACGGQKCTRIQLRTRSAGGTLGTTQTISPPGQNAANPEVDVDPSGNAVVVWQRSDGTNTRIQTVARSAGGTLSAVQTLSAAGQNAQSGVVGVDDSGDAAFAWTRQDGTTGCGGGSCARTQVRFRSAGGTLSTTAQTLSAANANTFNPRIGVDTTGNAVVSWARQGDAQTRARSSTGTLSAIQTLGTRSGPDMVAPVAVNASGAAVFVWTNAGVKIKTRSASGTLGAMQGLSGTSGFAPEVGIDSSGNAVAVWRLDDATTSCDGAGLCSRIQSRTRSSTGTLGTSQFLSQAMHNAIFPRVAVNANGTAAAEWERFDGTDLRVQGATQPAPAKIVISGGGSNVFTPSTVTVNVGGTVTWNNAGGLHNVHFDDNSFVQPNPASSSNWSVSRTFNTAGTFRYYCDVHGGPGGVGMSGTVVVN